MSILSSQADPLTLKNVGFMERELDFRKIKVSDLKMLLMVFWASLGLILGALGAFLGALLVLLRAFGGTLTSQDFCFGALEASSCPPRSPQQPSGRPQSEADGLPKPPRRLGRRLAAYFSEIWMAKCNGRWGRKRRETSGTSYWVMGTVAV